MSADGRSQTAPTVGCEIIYGALYIDTWERGRPFEKFTFDRSDGITAGFSPLLQRNAGCEVAGPGLSRKRYR